MNTDQRRKETKKEPAASRGRRVLWIALGFYLCSSVFICGRFRADEPRRLDPAAWGGDHVGKAVPEYVTGDECLFCHRKDVGHSWGKNRHQLTLREAEPDQPALAELKKSPAKELAA